MREKFRRIFVFALVCGVLFATSCGKDEAKGKEVSPADTSAISSEEVSPEEEHGYRLMPADFAVNGVHLGMSPDEVTAILGEPNRQTIGRGGATHGGYISMDYSGMNLWFNEDPETKEHRLDNFHITGEEFVLVNGVHVGCTVEEIINAFDHQDIDVISYAKTISYAAVLYNSAAIQPFGYDENWPDEPIQFGYYYDYFTFSDPIHYQYFEPPVWNEDKTQLTKYWYDMAFRVTPGEDKVTEIDISSCTETLPDE